MHTPPCPSLPASTDLRQKFEELADASHPLRQALDKLATLDFVRIIEGKV